MSKNLNNLILIIALTSILSCQNEQNIQSHQTIKNAVYTDTIANSNNITDLYKKANDNKEFPYSDLVISNSIYDYGYNQYTIDKNIKNVLFINDSLSSISFNNNLIYDLTLKDCYINNLLITSSNIKNLNITNCKINSIEIISSPFNQININTPANDTINNILIKNCEESRYIYFDGNFGQITLDGGLIDLLDITKIKSKNSSLKVMGTKLSYPNFYNSQSNNSDVFVNSHITPSSFTSNFILKEDRELTKINSINSYNTNRTEIFNRFRFVEQSYEILSEKLKTANDKQLSNYFDYRKSKTHNLLNKSYSWNKLSVLWNEYFRGNYGTSVNPIILTFIFSWLLFTFFYVLLGHMKFVFFYYKTTNDEGKTNDKSYFITLNQKLSNLHRYFVHCLWFSLSQMVAGSVISSLNFGRFTTLYLTPPRKYFTLGIGVFLSILQNVIGIILVFNFVTTFISISLK